ncbi:vacuolar protein sorting-associated protein 13A-like isoform X2 [Anneissia japonica]|uniref:vacuolar protein sorting-associated protein 13A-like isoform X2 n=1 Tax=Anneissia japonica TaxID=1529436 RepID=UPI0014259796|nr:vacuolar protein sorting-associated protein 13A-like isoform X2 [Anneissia japonica]
MVLERIVASILNKYLDKYIENLDTDNLDVGLFSGQLNLQDLELKPEALYELDLPIEVKEGRVGKISFDIPWTSLFSSPVIVKIEDVLLLANPVTARPYDELKERRLENAAKRKKLEQLEKSKKKPLSEEDEQESQSFTEKLMSSIINNVQVFMKNVHVRYEDSVTNPGHPFSFGVMLPYISAETTDELWQATQVDASAMIMRKLAQVRNLSIYMNSDCKQLLTEQHIDDGLWIGLMKEALVDNKIMNEPLQFILEPVTTKARVTYDKASDSLYMRPRLVVDINTEEIMLGLGRSQYLDVLDLLEALQLMKVNTVYRKYQPTVPVKIDPKAWWIYAYKSMVDKYIKPWSWEHMKQHRQYYRAYKNKYKEKLEKAKADDNVKKRIEKDLLKLEEKLDVTSITIAREQAKIEYAKQAPIRREKELKKEAEKSWFSGFWGWFGGDDDYEEEVVHDDTLWERLTEEDKHKIYEGIGYKEGASVSTDKPVEYVQTKVTFAVNHGQFGLRNKSLRVIKASVVDTVVDIEHRPANNGIHFQLSTDSLLVEGSPKKEENVTIVTSARDKPDDVAGQVFNVDLETSPVNVSADLSLAVTSEPVDIVYHEKTISELITFFTVPNLNMENLKAVASTQLMKFAEYSTAGLKYAIENHKTIQLDVDVKSPNILIPEFGSIDKGGHLIVIDLGSLRVFSDLQNETVSLEGATRTEIEEHLYDKFNVHINDIQILLAHSGDNWHESLELRDSERHLLPSFGLQLSLFNSVQPEYKELPQLKVEAVLPSVKVNISENKLKTLLQFAHHLPLPSNKNEPETSPPRGVVFSLDPLAIKMEPSVATLRRVRKTFREPKVKSTSVDESDTAISTVQPHKKVEEPTTPDVYYSASDHSDQSIDQWAKVDQVPDFGENDSPTNRTTILLRFLIREVVCSISTHKEARTVEDIDSGTSSDEAGILETEYLTLRVDSLMVDGAISTHGMAFQFGLGGIQVIDKLHVGALGTYLHLVSSASKSELISILYRKVTTECPDFQSYYNGMEQAVVVKFTALNVIFHKTAMLYLRKYVQNITQSAISRPTVPEIHVVQPTTTHPVPVQPKTDGPSITSHLPAITKLHIQAKMDFISVSFMDTNQTLAKMFIRDLEASMTDKENRTTIRARLKDFSVEDSEVNNLYTKILCLEDPTAFETKLILFKHDKKEGPPVLNKGDVIPVDACVRLRVGRVQAVLVYQFVRDFINFFEPFSSTEVLTNATVASQKAVQKQVKELTKQGMRINLNVNIRAPVILIPQSFHSPDTLVVHLGDLIVKNQIKMADNANHLIDCMKVSLNSVQISRATTGAHQVLGSRRLIVEPVSLHVDITRALAPFPNEIIPFDISGRLENIKVNIGEDDLVIIFAVLNENLFPVSEEVALDKTIPMIHESTFSQDINESVATATIETPPNTNIKMAFVMEGMEIELFTNEPRLRKNGQGLLLREEQDGLSRFQLHEVEGNATFYDNGAIMLSASIHCISLEDIRWSSPLAIKRLIHQTGRSGNKEPKDKSANTSPMVTISFTKDSAKNRHLDFCLEGMRINIFIHYLLAVYNFLSSSIAKAKPASTNASPTGQLNRQLSNEASAPTKGSLKITGRLKKPEVVLFADPTSQNSQVLVLQVEGNLSYQQSAAIDRLEASLKDIQIFSCIYSQALRTAYQVLDPCVLNLHRTLSHQGVEEIGVNLSSVRARISPRVVFMIQDIVHGLRAFTVKTPKGMSMNSDDSKEDMWTPKPIFSTAFPKRKENDQTQVDFSPLDAQQVKQKLTIETKHFELTLDIEQGSDHLPMLCVRSKLETVLTNWSTMMHLKLELSLEAWLYNERLTIWEPLIEPVMEKEGVYRPWELLVRMCQAPSQPITCTNESDVAFQSCDQIDGTSGFIQPTLGSESGSETDSSPDDELEWDGNYSSSLLSSDVGTPSDAPDRTFNPVSEKAADGEGEEQEEEEGSFLNKVVGFISDMFSDSESEEGDEGEGDGEESGRRRVKHDAHGRPRTAASLTSSRSQSRDDFDFDEPEEKEKLATYIIISSLDQMDLSVTPFALESMNDITDGFINKPDGLMETKQQITQTPFTVCNTTSLPIKVELPTTLKRITSGENVTIEAITDGTEDLSTDEPDMNADNDNCFSLLPSAARSHVRMSLRCVAPPAPHSEDDDDDEREENKEEDTPDAIVFKAKHSCSPKTPVDSICVQIEGFDPLKDVKCNQVGQMLYYLSPVKDGIQYAVVADVSINRCKKTLTIRSPLQLHNHLAVPMSVYYDLPRASSLTNEMSAAVGKQSLGVFQPNTTMDLPLDVAYSASLYFGPYDQGYTLCNKAVQWQRLIEKKQQICISQTEINDEKLFHFKCILEAESPARKGVSVKEHVPLYTLQIYPPIVLHNYLPYDVIFSFEEPGLKFLLAGENMAIYSINPEIQNSMKIQVKNYLSSSWEGTVNVSSKMKHYDLVSMTTKDSDSERKRYLNLGVHMSSTNGLDIFLYSPYWIVNKSELPIEVRASKSSKVFGNQTSSEPVLFNFSSPKRKKAKMRVFHSVWSSSFSLDTIGSSGVVVCKDETHNRTYQFWVEIQMSRLSLTKIVTITPYHLVTNMTRSTLCYLEEGVKAGVWVNIKPDVVQPFWPGTASMKLYVRHPDTPDRLASMHFSIDKPHFTVLKMERGTALSVKVEGGFEGPMHITFLNYQIGHAPVRIENRCHDVFLRFNQKSVGSMTFVKPSESLLYTWEDPTLERMLMWNLYNRNKQSVKAAIDRDGFGKLAVSTESIRRSSLRGDGMYADEDDTSVYSTDEEDVPDGMIEHPLMSRKERSVVYWVSYLDGLQRVFLITQSARTAKKAMQANEAEQANLELIVSLAGLGISLINGAYEEVAYMKLFSNPARWEVEKLDKWKMLNMEMSGILEDRWKNGDENISIEDAIDADLVNMLMSKPVEGKLRRTSQPAMRLQYRQSEHCTSIHFKLQKLQLDNQLHDALFTTVLRPAPLPKDVVKKSGFKPFLEMSLIRRQSPENNLNTVKYFKVLLQEAVVKIDNGFVLSVLDIFSGFMKEEDDVVYLKADIAMIKKPLHELSSSISNDLSRPIYFEYFHLGPIKLIVSLSLSGEPHRTTRSPKSFKKDVFKFFIDSIGSTLTEISDVEIKLGFFERSNVMLTQEEMITKVVNHYKGQAIKQAYVFILGLDVLGNPYGLFKDIKEGLGDLFYEPYQGAIQGPGEFAEGLARGVESLLGHTVGGVADSLSGFTSGVGKTLAFLTFDESYQERRLRKMRRKPSSLPLSILYAGQGFLMGIIMGLVGVVSNPIKGAQMDGIKGFFKGIGKGILGLFTRPLGGIVDASTFILEGIERSTEVGEDVMARKRLPRFINPNVGLKPYSAYQAIGNAILYNVRRAEVYKTDIYLAHAVIHSDDGTPDVAVVTNRQLMKLDKCRWYGGWDLEESDLFTDITSNPTVEDQTIMFNIKDEDGDVATRDVLCNNHEVAKWLNGKLKQAIDLQRLEMIQTGVFLQSSDA